MKLELKHLAPYLPYGLKYLEISKGSFNNDPNRESIEVLTVRNIEALLTSKRYRVISCKPILRPLQDFYESVDGVSFSDMITHGYHNSFWQKENFNFKHLMYWDFKLLVSKHADVFGLIEKGLAIDINTLEL